MPSSRRILSIGLGVLVLQAFVGLVPAAGADPAVALDDRVVVKFRREFAASALLPEQALPAGLSGFDDWSRRHGIRDGNRLVRRHGISIGNPEIFTATGLDRIYVLRLPASSARDVEEIIRELSSEPWVEYAEPVYVYKLLSTIPDDPLFPQQWAHENSGQSGGTVDADMDSTDGWDVATGAPSAVVAIMDSGVDVDHPDLVDNLLPGFDLTGSASGIQDDFSHGTQVAGNAAARGNNGQGVAGICWGCAILPIKIVGDTGFATIEEIADGLRLAADSGADAINMSFGSVGWSQAFLDAVDYAVGLGALPVGGSGNSGGYTFFSPAAFPQVVSVGGSTDQDLRVGDYGDHAELAAPTDFMTTNAVGGYETFWGTSASSPLVAGLAGLLRSHDPNLHVQELRQLLRLGADDQVGDPAEDTPGWDPFLGFGRLNAAGTMAMVDGPWLALDRAHYVCAGDLWVDLKDTTAGVSVDVTVAGDLSGDTEFVTVAPVTAYGYYRGGVSLAWLGVDGPAVPGDGRLHVVHGETITASLGALTSTAVTHCRKAVCLESLPALPASGDCDADGVADPGEIWVIEPPFENLQTELMSGGVAGLTTTSFSIEMRDATEILGDLPPFEVSDPGAFAFRVLPGSEVNEAISMAFVLTGAGWETDPVACADAGYDAGFVITGNSDGSIADSWKALPPASLTGSAAGCPTGFDLNWAAVDGAASYAIYRSEISCQDADRLTSPYGVTSLPAFSDAAALSPSDHFYAVEAIEPVTGCVSLRSCVPGACLCARPADPSNLRVDRGGDDILLVWDDPEVPGVTWNIYRDGTSDPTTWGAPLYPGVVDAEPATPGIQFTDVGGASVGVVQFYLSRAQDDCAESPPN